MGVGDGTKPNIHGEKPWINNNPLTPNEGYFKIDSGSVSANCMHAGLIARCSFSINRTGERMDWEHQRPL